MRTRYFLLLLQRQCFVEHEPTRADEAAHLALLLAIWHQFVFEGLEALHGRNYTLSAMTTTLGTVGTAFS